MTKTKNKIAIFSILFILTSLPVLAQETQEPFLEAWHLYQKDQPQAGDLQRQIVFLNAQTRLTPNWAEPYRQLTDIYLQIGRVEQAKKACQKYLAHQPQNAYGQLQLINIELQQYQMTEVRRQYLEQILKDRKDLLPEVISDIYRQLGEISYQNFENDRAAKYLDLAIRRVPQNLKARQMVRVMVDADKQSDGLRVLGAQVGEYQGRVLTNPLDGYAGYKLGILAGKVGLSAVMKDWLAAAETLRKRYGPGREWPATLTLELAESYLAVGRPKDAVELLEKLLPRLTSTGTTTQPDQGAMEEQEARARILLLIGGVKLGDDKIVRRQSQWLEHLTKFLKHSGANPSRLALVSLYYSVYGEMAGRLNPATALTLAQNAVKTEPENRRAQLALALALARSGETRQTSALLKQLDRPGDSLVLLGRILCDLTNKKDSQARSLLAKTLSQTPYGPLRDCLLKMAGRITLNNPPPPDTKGFTTLFNQVDPKALKFHGLCALTLKTRGNPSKGETVELSGTLTNTGPLPLVLGPGGFVSPNCAIEVKAIPAGNTKLFLDIPIDARQILPPGKSVTFTALLDQAVSLDRKTNWDGFIAGLPGTVTQLTMQGKIYTQVILAETSEFVASQTPLVTLEAPQIGPALASQIKSKLSESLTDNPWPTARLCRWVLGTNSKNLSSYRPSITEELIGQLQTSTSQGSRPAVAWALHAATPDGNLFNALAGLLNSKAWFTRLMALDTLGRLQGRQAQKLFQSFAVKDPDELVRQLSTGYLLYR